MRRRKNVRRNPERERAGWGQKEEEGRPVGQRAMEETRKKRFGVGGGDGKWGERGQRAAVTLAVTASAFSQPSSRTRCSSSFLISQTVPCSSQDKALAALSSAKSGFGFLSLHAMPFLPPTGPLSTDGTMKRSPAAVEWPAAQSCLTGVLLELSAESCWAPSDTK